jgi:hypothetical protein
MCLLIYNTAYKEVVRLKKLRVSLLQALETPVGFSTRLYTLVTEDLGMNVYQVVNLIKKSYACNDKGCWDIGDVGSNCC